MKSLDSLSPRELLALAVWTERTNAKGLRAFVPVFAGYEPAVAARLEEIASVVDAYESILMDRFKAQYGPTLPDMKEDWKVLLLGFEVSEQVPAPIDAFDLDDGEHMVFDSLTPDDVFRLALREQQRAREFYRQIMKHQNDAELVALYRELANLKDANIEWLKFRLKERSPD